MKSLLVAGLFLACGSAHAADPLVFSAGAKIEIDTTGNVTAVEPAASLSPALQDLVRGHLATYRFQPPMRDGVAVTGTTYVTLGGCAIPAGDEYNVSLAFRSNGPGLPGDGMIPPPRYPPAAFQNGAEADALVIYVVEADGSTSLERIDYKGTPRQKRVFDKTLREWLAQMRYRPERIAGTPVRTRMEIPVKFELREGSFDRAQKREILARPECTAAKSAPGLLPVAMDSPFKRLPPQG